ncbi:hypothetical protein [Dyadobacter crusticola]|uniref:hypothetical protein n=1 Tax=Dyadobacter crusticola TaxID=292407 RepID=UPI0004E1EE40|nr:hypothetical protein [Dyadobacter crusticola]
MRKNFDQFWMELLEGNETAQTPDFEILTKDGGEELRGGDRPYMPGFYETTTGRANVRSGNLLENLGLNNH